MSDDAPIFNEIVKAFEIRDRNLDHVVRNISEALKVRDQHIVELERAVATLIKKVDALENEKVDSIILKE